MPDIPEIAEQSRKPREANRQEWIERLARFDSSGMTVLDFCRAEAIAAQSFCYIPARGAAEAVRSGRCANSRAIGGLVAGSLVADAQP